jgi:hypothetical protein
MLTGVAARFDERSLSIQAQHPTRALLIRVPRLIWGGCPRVFLRRLLLESSVLGPQSSVKNSFCAAQEDHPTNGIRATDASPATAGAFSSSGSSAVSPGLRKRFASTPYWRL